MAPLLSARGLTLEYSGAGGTFTAVDNVDIDLEENSYTGIVGPSGSGKSSLLYILSGLRAPSGGRIAFRDRDYARLGGAGVAALRRQSFGFIFQQHFLVNYLGALENVMVGALTDNRRSRARAAELLERVGLGDKFKQRPYQLSVGERQRVAIVRSMISEPAIIFADEPTASLDQRTGHEVINLLGEYRAQGSILVVTHDLGMTTGFDRVVEMHDGRLTGPLREAVGAASGDPASSPRGRGRTRA